MTDLALFWDADRFAADLHFGAPDLETDEGLRSAVIVSLFTDARARQDDPVPDDGDRRGWWADSLLAAEDPRMGSRLWLLSREKLLPRVVERARGYVEEALAWMVSDGVASSVHVTAESAGPDRLTFGVVIAQPSGQSRRYDLLWKATA